MRFENIFIVTYGRSGSTLLQGILNSNSEILIKGENSNFLYRVFNSYEQILKTIEIGKRLSKPDNPKNAWYGYSQINAEQFLADCKVLVDNVLFAGVEKSKMKIYGFKEIRYPYLNDFEKYLHFIKTLYPNACFIFNTRNLEDVIKSGWWKKQNKSEVIKLLTNCENNFNSFFNKYNSYAYQISYEQIIDKESDHISDLFKFLDITYDSELIRKTLDMEHSIN